MMLTRFANWRRFDGSWLAFRPFQEATALALKLT
jgi:hypothetical protein